MKKKIVIIFSAIVVILIIVIIAFGVQLHNKTKRIENLEKAKIAQNFNKEESLNQVKANGEKIAGIDFKNLNFDIMKNGNNETIDVEYTLEGKDQKEVTLKAIKLDQKDGKWIVDSKEKLTDSEKNVVEKLANSQMGISTNMQKEFKEENAFMDNMQKQMNSQFQEMNKQFNQMFSNQ